MSERNTTIPHDQELGWNPPITKREKVTDGEAAGIFAELAYQQRQAEAAAQHRVRFNAQMAQIEAERVRRKHELVEIRARSDARLNQLRAEAAKRAAEFDASNIAAAERLSAIDSLLTPALERLTVRIDDLAKPAVHPPFDGGDLERPLAKPAPQAAPPEPVYQPPPQPQGLAKMFGIGQFAEAEQAARAKWQQQHAEWTSFVEQVLPAHNEKVSEQYEANERERLERLASARAAYKIDCEAREETARAHQQLI